VAPQRRFTERAEGDVEHQDALEALGLDAAVDLPTLKRRFRALAHDHHPDRGGDAARFAAINDAYRRLTAGDVEVAVAPTVAKGRPSRIAGPSDDVSERMGLDLTAEELTGLDPRQLHELRAGRRRPLTPLLFAELIRRLGPSRHLVLVSRAPNAWANRLAAVLSEDAVTTLRCSLTPDGRNVVLELRARARPARRHLARSAGDAGPLPSAWRRQRSDASTTISSLLTVSASSAATAIGATAHLTELLTVLDWPLEQWRLDADASRALLDAA